MRRVTARRSEEKQAEIEELRAEVRRAEANLRTAHRDCAAQQDKAELHAKFSAQYLAELEELRARLDASSGSAGGAHAGRAAARSNGSAAGAAAGRGDAGSRMPLSRSCRKTRSRVSSEHHVFSLGDKAAADACHVLICGCGN